MKGKGEQTTYWLIGENLDKHVERCLERKKKKALSNNGCINRDQITCLQNCMSPNIPRSSLKRNRVPRCVSFESHKKLRFASRDRILTQRFQYELTVDNKLNKKSYASLIENSLESLSEALRTSSSSCPCIENLVTSIANIRNTQQSVLSDEKPSYLSVPCLFPSPYLGVTAQIQTVSAPASPNRMKSYATIAPFNV